MAFGDADFAAVRHALGELRPWADPGELDLASGVLLLRARLGAAVSPDDMSVEGVTGRHLLWVLAGRDRDRILPAVDAAMESCTSPRVWERPHAAEALAATEAGIDADWQRTGPHSEFASAVHRFVPATRAFVAAAVERGGPEGRELAAMAVHTLEQLHREALREHAVAADGYGSSEVVAFMGRLRNELAAVTGGQEQATMDHVTASLTAGLPAPAAAVLVEASRPTSGVVVPQVEEGLEFPPSPASPPVLGLRHETVWHRHFAAVLAELLAREPEAEWIPAYLAEARAVDDVMVRQVSRRKSAVSTVFAVRERVADLLRAVVRPGGEELPLAHASSVWHADAPTDEILADRDVAFPLCADEIEWAEAFASALRIDAEARDRSPLDPEETVRPDAVTLDELRRAQRAYRAWARGLRPGRAPHLDANRRLLAAFEHRIFAFGRSSRSPEAARVVLKDVRRVIIAVEDGVLIQGAALDLAATRAFDPKAQVGKEREQAEREIAALSARDGTGGFVHPLRPLAFTLRNPTTPADLQLTHAKIRMRFLTQTAHAPVGSQPEWRRFAVGVVRFTRFRGTHTSVKPVMRSRESSLRPGGDGVHRTARDRTRQSSPVRRRPGVGY